MCHEASAALGAGGRPAWYQIAVLETISSTRLSSPYHSLTHTRVHRVAGLASTAVSLGRRWPLQALGPRWLGRRGGAGANRLASSRKRVIRRTWRRTAAIRSRQAKLVSPTVGVARSGSPPLGLGVAWVGPPGSRLLRP